MAKHTYYNIMHERVKQYQKNEKYFRHNSSALLFQFELALIGLI